MRLSNQYRQPLILLGHDVALLGDDASRVVKSSLF